MAFDRRVMLQPSILDRLIDPALGKSPNAGGYSVEQMKQAVLRDLEDLLNTNQTFRDVPDELKQVRDSIVCYGLPDLTSMEGMSREHREGIAQYIRQVINRFEPRLRDVHVTLRETEAELLRQSVRFEIDARLSMEPAPDVEFETILEIISGQFTVKDVAP